MLETSLGNITFQFLPDKAPNHVRNFLRLASVGFYDGTAFHRVVKGFVIQGGFPPTRSEPLDITQERYVRKMPPEFNDTLHDKGIVSLAHGDDPASGDTSFFIVTRADAGARRQLHRLRPRGRWHGRRREDRGGARQWRDAGHASRVEESDLAKIP